MNEINNDEEFVELIKNNKNKFSSMQFIDIFILAFKIQNDNYNGPGVGLFPFF